MGKIYDEAVIPNPDASEQGDSPNIKQAAPFCDWCGAYHYPEENTLCERERN